MALDKKLQTNIDNSNLVDYPNGAIRDNSGVGDGTPVNRSVYSDIHEFFAKLMRMAKISYSGLPDNETNGYQLINALESFATKNSKIHSLTTVSGVININTRLGILVTNEFLIAKVNFNLSSETTIKGSDLPLPTILSISFEPSDKPFKSGDYLRLFYNGTSIVATRLADAKNIDALIAEKLYLKAATEAEEYAASTQLKATTPYTNALAFARRVIGLDSFMYLANASRNGLYSKEHWSIVNGLGSSPIKNVGWFSGLNVGMVSGALACSSDVTNATVTSSGGDYSVIRCTMANAMADLNYEVQLSLESQTGFAQDTTTLNIVFKPITTTIFDVALRENGSTTQSLKIHCRVIQL